MSLPAKLTFMASCFIGIGTIGAIHWKQQLDREAMRQGIIKDEERRRAKKEKLLLLQDTVPSERQNSSPPNLFTNNLSSSVDMANPTTLSSNNR
jgi:PET assembly of cytochrome c oxidase, mitochondrial